MPALPGLLLRADARRPQPAFDRLQRDVVEYASGDLAYLVQNEHLRYRVPQTKADATRDYRVTMVFRRESGQWRIVHRQADSLLTKQGGD